jgi:hypothetical protein
MPHAKLMGGQACVICGQAGVWSWHNCVLQAGPAIVTHGTKGVRQFAVQKGAQVG